jgi:hypothetical protein
MQAWAVGAITLEVGWQECQARDRYRHDSPLYLEHILAQDSYVTVEFVSDSRQAFLRIFFS